MTTLETLSRRLPIAVAMALGATATLVAAPAAAARSGGGHVAVGAGWHGGPGHYRGGHWGHRGYGRGIFWGGVGLGLGIGAIGYYGGYGGYYAPYYGAAYAPAYGSYYYYDDAPVVAAPVYRTLEPRIGQPVPQAPAAAEPIFYPRNGQSADATEADRRDCNRWATTQRGAMADASIFQRATYACMEGRGYTVK